MKKYLKYILILAVLGGGFGFYQYNKPHKNMSRASSNFKMEAPQLFADFENDEAAANTKYLDKIIEVSGTIANVSENEEGHKSITLESESMMFGVICELDQLTDHAQTEFKKGEEITLKGICSGMLSDVVLVRCVIVE